MKSKKSVFSNCKLLILAAGSTATAFVFLSPLFVGGNRAVAQENDPDPKPHVEATPTATCNPNAPWESIGERPSLKITDWKCVDESYQPIYASSKTYSQKHDDPCNPTRSCTLKWSHIGPIGVYETRTNPDTGEEEQVLVSLRYTFTETDSCGGARTLPPMEQPPQCCPAKPN